MTTETKEVLRGLALGSALVVVAVVVVLVLGR
jgi:hypothetical protein